MILVSMNYILRVKETDGTIHLDGWSVHLSVCPSVRQSVQSLSVFSRSVSRSVCPSYIQLVCPSVHPSVCLSVCLSSCVSICPLISLTDHQPDLRSICPTIGLSGLHRSQLLTVTGDCSCLVAFDQINWASNVRESHRNVDDPQLTNLTIVPLESGWAHALISVGKADTSSPILTWRIAAQAGTSGINNWNIETRINSKRSSNLTIFLGIHELWFQSYHWLLAYLLWKGT